MVNFCVGLGLVWVICIITKSKLQVRGFLGFVLMGIICYGLGYLVTHLVHL
jgi:hypothetical protein